MRSSSEDGSSKGFLFKHICRIARYSLTILRALCTSESEVQATMWCLTVTVYRGFSLFDLLVWSTNRHFLLLACLFTSSGQWTVPQMIASGICTCQWAVWQMTASDSALCIESHVLLLSMSCVTEDSISALHWVTCLTLVNELRHRWQHQHFVLLQTCFYSCRWAVSQMTASNFVLLACTDRSRPSSKNQESGKNQVRRKLDYDKYSFPIDRDAFRRINQSYVKEKLQKNHVDQHWQVMLDELLQERDLGRISVHL